MHFTISEPITPKMAALIAEMRANVAASETHGPFIIDDAEAFLDAIPNEFVDEN